MNNIYKTGYWESATAHNHHVFCPELAGWIAEYLKEKKDDYIYDLGCGLGNYLLYLENKGYKNLLGFEGSIPQKKVFDKIIKQDLTTPVIVLKKGIVICLEVGEHIPKEYMHNLIENIVNSCDSYLILSWAIKNQPGHGHVNCLDNHEVIELFENQGFIYLEQDSLSARNSIKNTAQWFKNTILIFKRDTKV